MKIIKFEDKVVVEKNNGSYAKNSILRMFIPVVGMSLVLLSVSTKKIALYFFLSMMILNLLATIPYRFSFLADEKLVIKNKKIILSYYFFKIKIKEIVLEINDSLNISYDTTIKGGEKRYIDMSSILTPNKYRLLKITIEGKIYSFGFDLSKKDYEAVRKIILDYSEGISENSVEILKVENIWESKNKKIIFRNNEKLLGIEKDVKDKLVECKKEIFFVKGIGYIFIFSVIRFYMYVHFSIIINFLFLVSFIWIIENMLDLVKKIYSNEIIRLDENKIITLKYVLEGVILYRKNINIEDVEKIYIAESKKSYNIFRRSKKGKVLYPFIENRRRLKIKLSNGEIYSWGVNLDDEEIEKVKTYLKDYLQENQLEYLVDF